MITKYNHFSKTITIEYFSCVIALFHTNSLSTKRNPEAEVEKYSAKNIYDRGMKFSELLIVVLFAFSFTVFSVCLTAMLQCRSCTK